jgi:hypothetical protein
LGQIAERGKHKTRKGTYNMTSEVTYVELVGAEQLGVETAKGVQISFADKQHWVPKSRVKIVDDKLYVEQWLATQNIDVWQGAWVYGTKHTKMVPDDIHFLDILEEAMGTLEKLRGAFYKRIERRQTK